MARSARGASIAIATIMIPAERPAHPRLGSAAGATSARVPAASRTGAAIGLGQRRAGEVAA